MLAKCYLKVIEKENMVYQINLRHYIFSVNEEKINHVISNTCLKYVSTFYKLRFNHFISNTNHPTYGIDFN